MGKLWGNQSIHFERMGIAINDHTVPMINLKGAQKGLFNRKNHWTYGKRPCLKLRVCKKAAKANGGRDLAEREKSSASRDRTTR